MKAMCRVLGASRSGYYCWLNRSLSDRGKENRELVLLIQDEFLKSRKNYGSPRIAEALKIKGYAYGRNRIARLMRAHQIRAKRRCKFTRYKLATHPFPMAPDLVKRNFNPSKPNEIWATDITQFWTKEGWIYLAAVMDLYSRRIVGWATEKTPSTQLTLKAFSAAIAHRKPNKGLIHHSDRGSQYANHFYQDVLKNHGIAPSMGNRKTCYDNAVIESFFHTLKMEHVHWNTFKSRKEATSSLFDYIELYYNSKRLHSTLGYKSPLQYEKLEN